MIKHLALTRRWLPAFLLAMPLAGLAQGSPQFKQLAGPPAEMHDMAPADPALLSTHSKSAMLPVTLKQDDNGKWRWRAEIPVEGENLRLVVFPGPAAAGAAPRAAGDWSVIMHDPVTKRAQAAKTLAAESRALQFGMSDQGYPADYYAFKTLARGNWQFSIEANQPGQGFILLEGAGTQRMQSNQVAFNQRVGQRIGMTARLYDGKSGAAQSVPGSVREAYLRITTPDRRELISPMFDDGLHQDGKAGDGVYGGDFLAERAGDFNVQVVLKGVDGAGGGFLRTAQHLIPIVDGGMSLPNQAALGKLAGAQRLNIRLDVSAPAAADHYRVYAEVWGWKAGNSNAKVPVPIAWIGGMAALRDGALELGLDTRWVEKAGAWAPFELRHVRIEDPDHAIVLASAERMALQAPPLPNLRLRADQLRVDEAMLMGTRPANLAAGSAALAAGSKLLLVHGYCSGDVWGAVAPQFSNAALFYDLHQNRSHDQFAQLILSFGASWNSYGIVAHSQGGAAALHLYNYYWSGLDQAAGGRLIQSVGTPYQGTALAGSLAAIASVFGAGCGANSDMTYSGAASWLAGISAAARAKANYFTTSFTDNPWVYDYCSLATDLLLSDPEDGVTERAYGQLPGGVNQGHKTGWCHTSGMRDPAQATDSVRNAGMSANAAR